ncbi:hypothetical protein [Halalkalirubrum salinum]|uniref:hypothetical protein n=1 Tax=Halalkalirubrum salinum TaxID=2563889 RepID=UPI0010FAD3FA|nr:hypothetical protein [Halalkalirubrum salinum]
MTVRDQLKTHLRENRRGMLFDLTFAIVWVTAVTILVDYVFVGAPTWAYYLFLAAGVPGYFGFVWSWDAARNQQQ